MHVCPACGFAPKHIAPVEVEEGELAKLERKKQKKDRKEYTISDKQSFLSQLNQHAFDNGYKRGKHGVYGWAMYTYVERFGCKPSSSMDWSKREPVSEDVQKFIVHRNIKRVKSKQKVVNL